MGTRLMYFIGGVCFCIAGHSIFTEPVSWSWKMQMYFHYGEIHKPLGILSFCIGLMCFYSTFRFINSIPEEFICLECEYVEVLSYTSKKTYSGPNCGSNMEELHRFYDRHPEKRNN